jgi:hypothetical protein
VNEPHRKQRERELLAADHARYAHGTGPEPHSYRIPREVVIPPESVRGCELAAGDAILVGLAEGDVEAVVTAVEVLPSAYAGSRPATWQSPDGRFIGIADYLGGDMVTRLQPEMDREAGS